MTSGKELQEAAAQACGFCSELPKAIDTRSIKDVLFLDLISTAIAKITIDPELELLLKEDAAKQRKNPNAFF